MLSWVMANPSTGDETGICCKSTKQQLTIFSTWAIFISVWLVGELATAWRESIGAISTAPLHMVKLGLSIEKGSAQHA